MDTDGRAAEKASAADPQPPRKARGLKRHQIIMLLMMALAAFMIVGGISSALWETQAPAGPSAPS